METEGPYTYPLTDRADIIKFLGAHQSYHPAQSWNGGFVLAWNIKVHYNFDTSGAAYREEFGFEERFDVAWDEEVEVDGVMFNDVCEDATRMYTDGEWTRYPGVEQGEWKFGINGRSGGYLILEDWSGPTPRHWKLYPMIWADRDCYLDWLDELDEEDLTLLYKAIVQLDQDLSPENCRKAIEYQYANRRAWWEGEQCAEEDAAARKLEASRPDMYEQDA